MLIYLLPTWAGVRLDPIRADWVTGYFVALGARAWGPALALVMSLTALAGAWAQYTGQLLYVLPLPQALAEDGFLPRALARTNPRGVPVAALWLCTAIFSLFALASFSRLLVTDVLLYSAGLALEFLALLRLRRRQPRLPSPFSIPLAGRPLSLLCTAPLLLAAVALVLAIAEDRWFTALALALLASGPLLYPALARRR